MSVGEKPWDSGTESASVEYQPSSPSGTAERSAIEAVLSRNADILMAIEGVEGVGIGRDRIGNEVIVVFVRDASVRVRVPYEVEGITVEISVTGIVDAG